jgi:hypothetical protein
MKAAIPLGAMVLGFVLLLASALWASMFPPTSSWTPEKDTRMSEVKARLNDLSALIYRSTTATSMHRGQDPATLKSEYDGLMKEFEQLKTDFETATERPQRASAVLKWSGITLAALGIVGWYAVKQAS